MLTFKSVKYERVEIYFLYKDNSEDVVLHHNIVEIAYFFVPVKKY